MDEQNNIIKTFTELAPHYEESVNSELSIFWGWSYKRFIQKFMEFIPINEGDRILDLATGTGVIPVHLKEKGVPQEHIHGLDITFSMLSGAKSRLSENGNPLQAKLVCASAMEMPYRDQSFDMITCALATHHMDAEKLIDEMYRVLKEGGCLFMADVGANKFWLSPVIKVLASIFVFLFFLVRESFTRARAEIDAITKVYTIEDWSKMLYKRGFRDIKITKLESKYSWIPEPYIVITNKTQGEENDQNK